MIRGLLILLGFAVGASARPPFEVVPTAHTFVTSIVVQLLVKYTDTRLTSGNGTITVDAPGYGNWLLEFSGSKFKFLGDTVQFSKTSQPGKGPIDIRIALVWEDGGVRDSIVYETDGNYSNPRTGGPVYYEFRELIPLGIAPRHPQLGAALKFYYDLIGRHW